MDLNLDSINVCKITTKTSDETFLSLLCSFLLGKHFFHKICIFLTPKMADGGCDDNINITIIGTCISAMLLKPLSLRIQLF